MVWQKYRGNRGGNGWKDSNTGQIVYQDAKPGGGGGRSAAPTPSGQPQAQSQAQSGKEKADQINNQLASVQVPPEASGLFNAMKKKAMAVFDELEGRYGRKAAIAIFAAGHVVGLATPLVVVPGSTFIGMAPFMAMGEVYRLFRNHDAEQMAYDLPPQAVAQHGVWLANHLNDEWKKLLAPEGGPGFQMSRKSDEVAEKANQANPDPSDSQKDAGNYKKGHVSIHGMRISIEVPKGGIRRGKDWESEMAAHYGYFVGTEGKDGDQVDVFVGDHPESEIAYILNQETKSGRFDEHKVLIGFRTEDQARKAYADSYEDGWKVGETIPVTIPKLKEWLKGGDQKRRFQMSQWRPYSGPKGGQGWQDESGNVAYQQDKPGESASALKDEGGGFSARSFIDSDPDVSSRLEASEIWFPMWDSDGSTSEAIADAKNTSARAGREIRRKWGKLKEQLSQVQDPKLAELIAKGDQELEEKDSARSEATERYIADIEKAERLTSQGMSITEAVEQVISDQGLIEHNWPEGGEDTLSITTVGDIVEYFQEKEESPSRMSAAPDPWQPYRGPKGGQGWRNTQTGQVVYQAEKPGTRGSGQEEEPQSAPSQGFLFKQPGEFQFEPPKSFEPPRSAAPEPAPEPTPEPQPEATEPTPESDTTSDTTPDPTPSIASQGQHLGGQYQLYETPHGIGSPYASNYRVIKLSEGDNGWAVGWIGEDGDWEHDPGYTREEAIEELNSGIEDYLDDVSELPEYPQNRIEILRNHPEKVFDQKYADVDWDFDAARSINDFDLGDHGTPEEALQSWAESTRVELNEKAQELDELKMNWQSATAIFSEGQEWNQIVSEKIDEMASFLGNAQESVSTDVEAMAGTFDGESFGVIDSHVDSDLMEFDAVRDELEKEMIDQYNEAFDAKPSDNPNMVSLAFDEGPNFSPSFDDVASRTAAVDLDEDATSGPYAFQGGDGIITSPRMTVRAERQLDGTWQVQHHNGDHWEVLTDGYDDDEIQDALIEANNEGIEGDWETGLTDSQRDAFETFLFSAQDVAENDLYDPDLGQGFEGMESHLASNPSGVVSELNKRIASHGEEANRALQKLQESYSDIWDEWVEDETKEGIIETHQEYIESLQNAADSLEESVQQWGEMDDVDYSEISFVQESEEVTRAFQSFQDAIEVLNDEVNDNANDLAVHPAIWERINQSPSKMSRMGCKWITIGANKDAKKGEKGGSPVCVDDKTGAITKGADGLYGKKVSNLQGEEHEFTTRQQNRHYKERSKAKWNKRAKSLGIDPKELHNAADERIKAEQAWRDDYEAVRKAARKQLGISTRNKSFTKGGDATDFDKRGLDDAANELAESYPHILGSNPSETLYDMMGRGKFEPIDTERVYNGLFEEIEAAVSSGAYTPQVQEEDPFDDPFGDKDKVPFSLAGVA